MNVTQDTLEACEVCGNEYDKPLRILVGDTSKVFDCFECAIQALAPECANCGVRIIGHGMEQGTRTFCCARCAAQLGATQMQDRA